MDAHAKVGIVLNEDGENEEDEQRLFNEIICYDSGDSDDDLKSNGCDQCDTTASNDETSLQNSLKNQENSTLDAFASDRSIGTALEKFVKRSNAAQMREYRARQRSDPLRYRQYLERERMRNYKRKYERRVQAAQERAQSLGIPYVVIEPPNARRGRKPKSSGMSLVLPSNYDGFDIEDKSLWYDSDDMPMVPVEVELTELDNVYQKQSPQISVVNINKLTAHPRSALQTLLPQEVNDRERISNSIKQEHDYVQQPFSVHDSEARKRSEKSKHKRNKSELLKLQQQCRSFILNRAAESGLSKSKRNRRQPKSHAHQPKTNSLRKDCVKHEDLDDLFKELAEVATKNPPKKRHASPHKKSPGKHSAREHSLYREVKPRDAGEFSLNVSMPVQPIAASSLKSIKIKDEPKSPASPWIGEESDEYKSSSIPHDNHLQSLNKSVCNAGDVYVKRNSIEIKQEPIHSDDDFL